MKQRLSELAWDVAFFAGSLIALRGIALWSHPAAYLAGGLELAAIGYLGGLDVARDWMDQ
jgi:hypothetical protein